MRLIAFAVAALIAAPALAAECIYDNERGATIRVDESVETFEVNFGDWTETCTTGVSTPHANASTAWMTASVATCDNFTGQYAFVSDAAALVFDGNVFYRRCD